MRVACCAHSGAPPYHHRPPRTAQTNPARNWTPSNAVWRSCSCSNAARAAACASCKATRQPGDCCQRTQRAERPADNPTVLDLTAMIQTTTALPAWLALPRQRIQGATQPMIRRNVLVDALMAGQSRRTGNLLRAVVLARQRLNTWPVRWIDPAATTGLSTPMPCPHVGRIRGMPR